MRKSIFAVGVIMLLSTTCAMAYRASMSWRELWGAGSKVCSWSASWGHSGLRMTNRMLFVWPEKGPPAVKQ